MEFFLYCILAIGSSVVMGLPADRLFMRQVLMEFKDLNRNIMHNGLMLHTPLANDVEECCSTTALGCFVKSLPQLPVPSSARKVKATLTKNLQKKIMENSVRSCSEDTVKTTVCPVCETYPQRNSQDFMAALETLLQKTVDRLS